MIVGFILKSVGLASWAYGDASGGLFDSFINDGVFKIDCGEVATGGTSGSGAGSGGPVLPSSGIEKYCNSKSWSPIWNCLAAYGNKDSEWFSYCEENPCEGVGSNGKGCHVVENGLLGIHCENIW